MRRTSFSLAVSAAVLALVLGGCSTGGSPAPGPDASTSSAAEVADDTPATDGANWAADPACADYVAQRSAAMEAEYDQHAELASVDDLPFALATDDYGWMGDEVACVWTVFRGDDASPTAFEMFIYAPEGDASYVLESSPDLTVRECATDDVVACYESADGVIVVVVPAGTTTGTEGFEAVVQGVGIQNLR